MAKETKSILICIDYKLHSDNKYPLIMDECEKIYEVVITQTKRLFSKIFIKYRLYNQ